MGIEEEGEREEAYIQVKKSLLTKLGPCGIFRAKLIALF